MRKLMFLLSLLVLILAAGLLAGCQQDQTDDAQYTPRFTREPVEMAKLTYPQTATVDQEDDFHGTMVTDPYRWLEDVDSEETHAWVEAQNKVTFAFLESIPARRQFKDRLTEIWDYARYGKHFKKNGKIFFYKNDGLQNQSVLYVQDTPEAEPRVLIVPNLLSEDGTVALGKISITDDGKLMAYSTSVSGSDWRTWYVRDVATAQDLDDKIEWSKFSGASWDADGEGFFYSRYDAPAEGETFEGTNYSQKLFYHKVGDPQEDDTLAF